VGVARGRIVSDAAITTTATLIAAARLHDQRPKTKPPTRRHGLCCNGVANTRRQMFPEEWRRLGYIDVDRRHHIAQFIQLMTARLARGEVRRRCRRPGAFGEVQ
jgi:hypothetical protein